MKMATKVHSNPKTKKKTVNGRSKGQVSGPVKRASTITERVVKRQNKSELSIAERAEIFALRKEKLSMREIGKRVGRAVSTICYTLKRFKDLGSHRNRDGRGRKSLLSDRDKRYLMLCAVRERTKTLAVLTEEFNRNSKFLVSHSIVNRALHKWSLLGRVAARKPLLSLRNVIKRLAFAKKHVKWTKKMWKKVLFTDKSKFELFGTKRRRFVRRFPGERFKKECLVPTVKHGGGSVMVWGGICVNGVTPLKRIVGIMDKKMYHSILVRQALPAGKKLIGKGFVFQEDNDPKHASKLCRNYLQSKEKSDGYS